jgi:hypothetical protein
VETSKVINPEKTDTKPLTKGRVLPADELKRLTDFFSLLIQIDRKNKARKEVKRYENQSIWQDGQSR